jgi:hypothetical protein
VNICDAMQAIKEGERVSRSGWTDKGFWIDMEVVGDDTCIYINFPPGDRVGGMRIPWRASQDDLLFTDWYIV